MSTPPRIHVSPMSLKVNGRVRNVDAAHHWTLLRLLRDILDLTGAKLAATGGNAGLVPWL